MSNKYDNNRIIGYVFLFAIITSVFAFRYKGDSAPVKQGAISVPDTANAVFAEPTEIEKKELTEPIEGADKIEKRKNYIERFYKTAQQEQKKYGIPASITLAQGILESGNGTSTLAEENNNHFGIKCFSHNCAKGHCRNFTDDSHKDFFRNFPNAWDSYRAHSEFLKQPRYRKLFKLNKKDYKGWAKGLKKCGYATEKYYAEKLIELIETNNLQKYD